MLNNKRFVPLKSRPYFSLEQYKGNEALADEFRESPSVSVKGNKST